MLSKNPRAGAEAVAQPLTLRFSVRSAADGNAGGGIIRNDAAVSRVGVQDGEDESQPQPHF